MKRLKMACRTWTNGTIYYVANLPGEGNPNSDWGYVTDPKKAKPLPKYWCRRFAADCRRVGSSAKFIDVHEQ